MHTFGIYSIDQARRLATSDVHSANWPMARSDPPLHQQWRLFVLDAGNSIETKTAPRLAPTSDSIDAAGGAAKQSLIKRWSDSATRSSQAWPSSKKIVLFCNSIREHQFAVACGNPSRRFKHIQQLNPDTSINRMLVFADSVERRMRPLGRFASNRSWDSPLFKLRDSAFVWRKENGRSVV